MSPVLLLLVLLLLILFLSLILILILLLWLLLLRPHYLAVSAFQTFGGDIGSSVNRLPVAA